VGGATFFAKLPAIAQTRAPMGDEPAPVRQMAWQVKFSHPFAGAPFNCSKPKHPSQRPKMGPEVNLAWVVLF